jgi:hypothetical protein
MNIFGKSRLWVTSFEDAHTAFLDAILRVWPSCRATCQATTGEDEITRKLVVLIRKDKKIRSSPFFVESQLELLPPDLRGDVTAKGYLDIAVLFFTTSRKVYFACECKRLHIPDGHGTRRSLATEYVLQGMMRFVRAQYAKSFPLGAMIGYVMDGDIVSATSAVVTQVRKYSRRLHCRSRDIGSGTPPAALTTMHRRACGDIRLTHLLVPFSIGFWKTVCTRALRGRVA